MTNLHHPWHEIAWNGVFFPVPADWTPAEIGRRHLVLETDRGPVMEIKWSRVRGVFSHRKHLRRLAARQAKDFSKAIEGWQLPNGWQQALRDFDAGGFRWQKREIGGRGVILFCPVCRTACLIQFFFPAARDPGSAPQRVLEGFGDHRQDGIVAWSMFDLRARIPRELSLLRHRFESGYYELTFSQRERLVTLHRWALAAELLKRYRLSEFAQRFASFTPEGWSSIRFYGADGVEAARRPRTGWSTWLHRLAPRSSHFWMRVWHLPRRNRILGVEAKGKRPLDRAVLEQICRSYETV
jgi:hypothetical protein